MARTPRVSGRGGNKPRMPKMSRTPTPRNNGRMRKPNAPKLPKSPAAAAAAKRAAGNASTAAARASTRITRAWNALWK